jgi:membrane protein DedA with SNARE-associated domain
MTDSFQTFAAQYGPYAYALLFGGVLLESAGVPLPGETTVLAAGYLASPAGGGHLDVVWVIVLTALAAMLGDNLGYELGKRLARPRLVQGKRFLFLTPEVLRKAEGYFERYGIWTIFFGRFIAALRVAAALAAGTAGMPWLRFFLANAAGAVAWATTITLLGYFFGNSVTLLHEWLGRGSVVVIGCIVLIVGLPFLLRRLRRLPTADRLLRSQFLRSLLVAVLELVCVAILVLLAQGHHATRLDHDLREWIASHPSAALATLASVGSYLGVLPVAAGVIGLVLVQLWHRDRPWRERAAAVWALAASEAVGWLLIGLLRRQHVELLRAEVWPFGFAGVVPLRAFAAFGMAAYLMGRQEHALARPLHVAAGALIVLAGFGVVYLGQQTLTEMLLEYAAGGLVLFGGIWWLEGYATLGWGEREESKSGQQGADGRACS